MALHTLLLPLLSLPLHSDLKGWGGGVTLGHVGQGVSMWCRPSPLVQRRWDGRICRGRTEGLVAKRAMTGDSSTPLPL